MSGKVRLTLVQDQAAADKTARLAYIIWHQHYDTMIGSDQVDYMLERFQSDQAVLDDINSKGYDYYLLEQSGTALGYYAVFLDEADCSLFLSKFYLLNEARGQGLARRMLEHMKQKYKPNKIWLTVNKNNSNSISVYKHLGFIIEKTQKVDIGSGYYMDDYVLSLNMSD